MQGRVGENRPPLAGEAGVTETLRRLWDTISGKSGALTLLREYRFQYCGGRYMSIGVRLAVAEVFRCVAPPRSYGWVVPVKFVPPLRRERGATADVPRG